MTEHLPYRTIMSYQVRSAFYITLPIVNAYLSLVIEFTKISNHQSIAIVFNEDVPLGGSVLLIWKGLLLVMRPARKYRYV